MQLEKAMEIFRKQFKRFSYELAGWTIGFDDSIRHGGLCNCRKKHVVISRRYALLNDEDWVVRASLHELAHALDFVRNGTAGHSWSWKRIVREIGGEDSVRMPEDGKTTFPFRYRLNCPTCGNEVYRNQLFGSKVFCIVCKAPPDMPEKWNKSAVSLNNPETAGSTRRGGYYELLIGPTLKTLLILDSEEFPLLMARSMQIISLCNSNWHHPPKRVQIGFQNLYETR